MTELSTQQLLELQDNAYELLDELVTPEGIYASANSGWQGPYHAWFKRDQAYTAGFIFSTVELDSENERGRLIAGLALDALVFSIKIRRGRKNDPATGEEVGAAGHEFRTELGAEHTVQHAARTNEQPWYVDPADSTLKNWDSADSTPLTIIETLHGQRVLGRKLDTETEDGLRDMLGWIVNRMEKYDGLVGFMSANLQPGRIYSGLDNQGWKDTTDIYQTPNGQNAPHPIKDVLVNAQSWAALRDGADYFAAKDPAYSAQLRDAADTLQANFNDNRTGFVLISRKGLAQAIDGNGNRLEQRAIDQGAVLDARAVSGELIVGPEVAAYLAEEMVSGEMLNPEAGIRNYALGTEFLHGTKYHGSPFTFWPFMSGVVARGLEQMGETDKAEKIMRGMLNAIRALGTNIEMFVQNERHEFEPWSHPDPEVGQMSSRQQAWTAGAVLYATSYLLREQREQGTVNTKDELV